MSNLRRIRIDKGLSCYELAKRVGLTPQAMAYLEKKAGAVPTLANARMIARALGVKVDSLWPVEVSK